MVTVSVFYIALDLIAEWMELATEEVWTVGGSHIKI
jgi:hypothetical protein